MDLSQQELPLTSYFPKGNKSRAFCNKDERTAEHSQSAGRPLKRTRNDESTAQPELRPKTLQLPTPAASARKRARGGHLLTSSCTSVEHKANFERENDLAQPEFGPSLLESPQSSRDTTSELPCTPSIAIETGIATPRTTSQRVPELRQRIDHSPLAYSKRPLLSKPKNSIFAPRDEPSVSLSETVDGQPSSDHAIPMFPVPSSQSQYLVHLDATPKRKQRSQPVGHIISSQTQEERELTLSSFLKPAAVVSLSLGASPGKHLPLPSPQTPRRGGRKSQCPHTLVVSPIRSPTNIPTSPSRSFATKKASSERSSEFSSPSRRKVLTSHSPSRNTQSSRALIHRKSIDYIPSAQQEDSTTEFESEVDILQVPRYSRVPPDGCPPVHHGFAQGNLASTEDDSATEPESDTEILHCVAEISKDRPPECQSKTLKKDAPPSPVISPLVTPAKSRIATTPLIMGNAELGAPDSPTRRPSATEPHVPSDSLPSVVRDFIHMFSGDGSYPVDFPESLRI